MAVLNKCEHGAVRNGVFMANKKTNLPGKVRRRPRPGERGKETSDGDGGELGRKGEKRFRAQIPF